MTSSVEQSTVSLIPFRGFSSLIKSLHVYLAVPLEFSQLSNFILSFPLLQDLSLAIHGKSIDTDNSPDGLSTVIHPSSLPVFAGSLKLWGVGAKRIARQLLALPGGLRFRKLTLVCKYQEDILLAAALVEGCSHTLESLEIARLSPGEFIRRLHPYW